MAAVTGRRNVVWKTPTLTSFGLKIYACAAMLIQSVGIVIVQNGIIHLERYTASALAEAMEQDSRLVFWAGVGSVMQLIGGLAVPVFAFLLVEGFLNTSDYRRYAATMLFFALLSEIPYDLAIHGTFLEFSGQNALFTMTICLLMLYFLNSLKEGAGAMAWVVRALIVFCAVAWATLFRTLYGFSTVLLTAVFYLLYRRNVLKTILGVLISLLHVTAPLSFYAIWFYNGQRGDRFSKYVFYAFYPLHLLALGLIVRFFMQ